MRLRQICSLNLYSWSEFDCIDLMLREPEEDSTTALEDFGTLPKEITEAAIKHIPTDLYDNQYCWKKEIVYTVTPL